MLIAEIRKVFLGFRNLSGDSCQLTPCRIVCDSCKGICLGFKIPKIFCFVSKRLVIIIIIYLYMVRYAMPCFHAYGFP